MNNNLDTRTFTHTAHLDNFLKKRAAEGFMNIFGKVGQAMLPIDHEILLTWLPFDEGKQWKMDFTTENDNLIIHDLMPAKPAAKRVASLS